MNPAKDLAKSNVTVSTQAGSEVGPGSYFIKEDGKRTQGVFLKSKRFAETKKDNADTPLFINDSQTKKRPPSCAIKKPGQKTRQLISRAQQ